MNSRSKLLLKSFSFAIVIASFLFVVAFMARWSVALLIDHSEMAFLIGFPSLVIGLLWWNAYEYLKKKEKENG